MVLNASRNRPKILNDALQLTYFKADYEQVVDL